MQTSKILHRLSRKARIRKRIHGTPARPRLTVFRSLRSVSAQLIDDDARKTIVAASSNEAKVQGNVAGAKKVGELLAEKAKKAGITSVVFDRSGYAFHGAVKSLADAARESGLRF
jgi:large subunit ribosomal protein L18